MGTTRFERDAVGGIRLHVLPTDRFKTTAVSVFVGAPLQESTVTKVALTPFVLRRGNATYPETKSFREALDDLYGAGFGFDIYKRGDYQIVNFRMDVIQNGFAGGAPLLQQAVAFLGETLTHPAIEDGRFLDSYVEAEKHTVQKKLEAIVNDKGRYAAERCIEEMCKDEPYRLHPLGRKDDLPAVDSAALYASYKEWLSQAPIDVYVVGNTTLEEAKRLVAEAFDVRRDGAPTEYAAAPQLRQAGEVRTVVERMDVNQGKLNMGLRTTAAYAEPNYATALVYNGILGSFPHSKLFLNVRERASLAYYASSRLDGHKGIITISSGIEIDKYERAVDIIKQQLDAMRAGDISDLEMGQTKAMITNHLREMNDSAYEMIGYDFNTVLSGKERTADTLREEIERVTPEDIVAFAQGVQLDTVYFLRDRKEG